MTQLEQQMTFLVEIDKLKTIVRRSYLADGSRRENDAEHSWHLAMMAVVLAGHFEDVDILKVVTMVLIHDLVEIDAGDTFLYDAEGNEDKMQREKEAADRLFPLLPSDQADTLRALWDEFEDGQSREAVCAGILDRMQPLMLVLASEGKTWQEHGINEAQWMDRNRVLIERAPPAIADYIQSRIRDAVDRGWLAKAPADRADPC